MEKGTQHISYEAFFFLLLSCLFIFFLKVYDLPSRFSASDNQHFDLYGGPEALQSANGAHRLVLGLSVDINSATLDELTVLPGIGKALAARVLEERSVRGGFRSIEELKDVKGIGTDRLKASGPFIEVKGRPDL
jgi:competence ComEA-like helix-hairpin-helix protein